MARMLCLAIGVGDAPPLDYLRGAVNGAHAVAQWAEGAGYDTLCLTDGKKPLELTDVKAALESLIAGAPADRLIIHFAGHGVSQGAAEELWLLSRWKAEQEAVSVSGLRRRLERFGIRQLAIISDACRNVATEAETVALDRRSVLGLGPEAEAVPQTDIFYASSNRRVAYMVGTKEKARCIFTSVLVEGLSGVDDAAFDGGNRTNGISSSSLARYLLDRVPKVAATYGVELKPDPRPGFWPPEDKWVPGHPNPPPPPPRPEWPVPDPAAVAGMGGAGEARLLPGPGESWSTLNDPVGLESAALPLRAEALLAADDAEDASLEAAAQAVEDAIRAGFPTEQRPTHAETGFILNVTGAELAEGRAGPFARLVPHWQFPVTGGWVLEPEPDRLQMSIGGPWWAGGVPLKAPLPLLLRMADGAWVGSAALPHFVLSVGMDESGAQSIIFRNMNNPIAPSTEALMARLGARGLAREDASMLAGELRAFKDADPMLGVIAAYLHEASGDIANVRRIAAFFAQQGQPIPFDIALLGRLAAMRMPDGLVRVEVPEIPEAPDLGQPWYLRSPMAPTSGLLAGAFPWMRQGWWLLLAEGEGDLYPEGLSTLARHLKPAPFTTLDAVGGEALADLVFGKG